MTQPSDTVVGRLRHDDVFLSEHLGGWTRPTEKSMRLPTQIGPQPVENFVEGRDEADSEPLSRRRRAPAAATAESANDR